MPALAVADALRRRGVHVTFAGSAERVEARLVPEAGFPFDSFRISGWPRRPGPALARALGLAARAPLACARILAARRPDVVLGGGGYVSGPMVLAAWRRGTPAGLMEADAHLGLANRLAARFARRVFLAYALPGRGGEKYRVVGRPIPETSRPVPRDEARRSFDLPAAGPVLLVSGALAGARALNEFAVEHFGRSGPPVLHLSGERDYEALRRRVTRPDYRLLPFTDRFGAALAAADLALSRAGGTVWELAAAGVPAVLVPYPHATGDHQTKNARYFERAGGAIVVPERELGRAVGLVGELIEDFERLERMRDAMRSVARPDAAEEIAEELVALATP
ncbi:MAG: UDP-N-acetylglucosamine--N-acetylmuramyl-(pentapeptide) pyrophosphoryl-undecaprenol N-acetylglucosamine transferase [Actinomycetota bacterium]|nr:UDP-N-acetylglucosamine--N-acetylmuramyl-(pentapeptide) pyrophosphoryl-undecaprenol N-acetylglucosamine transferase [Actinomycetota bacterium]